MSNQWIVKFAQFQNLEEILSFITLKFRKLCGYIFTNNGFINLFKLLKEAYNKEEWTVNNPNLDILVIAGKQDPVIQSEEKFMGLVSFLKGLGYKNIASKLYEGKRHELLNEKENIKIYEDILGFIEKP